jgi:hypothetical protein
MVFNQNYLAASFAMATAVHLGSLGYSMEFYIGMATAIAESGLAARLFIPW